MQNDLVVLMQQNQTNKWHYKIYVLQLNLRGKFNQTWYYWLKPTLTMTSLSQICEISKLLPRVKEVFGQAAALMLAAITLYAPSSRMHLVYPRN